MRIREEFPTPAADVVERREEGKRESRRSGRSEEEGGVDGWGLPGRGRRGAPSGPAVRPTREEGARGGWARPRLGEGAGAGLAGRLGRPVGLALLFFFLF